MTAMGSLMVDVEGVSLTAEDREVLANPLVGGLILFTRNFKNKSQIIELIKEIRDVQDDILIAVDYEGGRVQRFREEFTRLPPMRSLGLQFDQQPEIACEMATNLGWLIATELGAVGIDMPLTPVVDLEFDRCAVIGDRAFHREPEVVIQLAAALQTGLAQAGMVATAKHFPGHGAVVEDSHLELPVDERDWEALQQDIAPYRGLIAQGLGSIMMAHIRYPAIDTEPASLSAHWIQGVLREELGFNGAVFCDDLSMGGAAVVGSYTERAEMALAAGCDILPVCNNRAAVLELLDNLPAEEDAAASQRRNALRRQPRQNNEAGRAAVSLAQIQQLNALVQT